MKIVPVAATWSRGFPVAAPGARARPGAGGGAGEGRSGTVSEAGDEEEDAVAVTVRFARLLAVLATEVMDSLKKVENGAWGDSYVRDACILCATYVAELVGQGRALRVARGKERVCVSRVEERRMGCAHRAPSLRCRPLPLS
jgi:hypothetical protein